MQTLTSGLWSALGLSEASSPGPARVRLRLESACSRPDLGPPLPGALSCLPPPLGRLCLLEADGSLLGLWLVLSTPWILLAAFCLRAPMRRLRAQLTFDPGQQEEEEEEDKMEARIWRDILPRVDRIAVTVQRLQAVLKARASAWQPRRKRRRRRLEARPEGTGPVRVVVRAPCSSCSQLLFRCLPLGGPSPPQPPARPLGKRLTSLPSSTQPPPLPFPRPRSLVAYSGPEACR